MTVPDGTVAIPSRSPKRGAIPTPRSELAAAIPHIPITTAPPIFIRQPPLRISSWGNFEYGDCVTAEEAFAKACNNPEIFISDNEAISWATRHGVLEGAYLTQVMRWMQSHGFRQDGYIYDDGPYFSVNRTDATILQSAIFEGPVKLGVASTALETAWRSTGGNTGWFGVEFEPDDKEDHCITLFGYGPFAWLAAQLRVQVPAGIDGAKQGYAVFIWDTMGIIDQSSMIAITHEAWLRRPTTSSMKLFHPVYQGPGIGGYDLSSENDRALAFDYDSSGKVDHLVLYRPGKGIIWILKNANGSFSSVPHGPGPGIGGYDLSSEDDRALAFDYDGSGKLDHLVLYRPGKGIIRILKNATGNFSSVPHGPGPGIGGYDLSSDDDRALAFDYNSSGKLDHLVLYRPGKGIIWILKNANGNFSSVPHGPGPGIGGYELSSDDDRALAFDYDGSGTLDHLVLYRPGKGIIRILKNANGNFSSVYQLGNGIGGYDLSSEDDRALAFDYDGSGKLDHIVLYRPGRGIIWLIEKN